MDDQRDVTSARTASIDTAGATTCVATPRLAVAPCAAVTPLSSDDMVAANDNRSSLRQCGTSCTCKAHSAAAAREQGKHVLRVRPIPPLVLAGDTGRPLR